MCQEENSRPERNSFPLSCAAIFYFFLLFGACGWILLRGGDLTSLLGSSWGRFFADLLLGAALAFPIVGITVTASSIFSAVKKLEDFFQEILGSLRFREILVLALLSGIAEEAFFRGALQPVTGLVLASLLFGLLHAGPGRIFIPWTVFAIGTGFLLGFLFEARGSLAAPVATHFTVNLINLNRICRAGKGSGPEGEEKGSSPHFSHGNLE